MAGPDRNPSLSPSPLAPALTLIIGLSPTLTFTLTPSQAYPLANPKSKPNQAACRGWAEAGECVANAVFMRDACRLSCGACCTRAAA